MKPRTIVGSGLLALIVAGLVYVAFREDPAPVDLHTVESAPMQITINADGQTRIREVYDVATPISGIALRAPVELGDPVTARETIVAVVEPVEPALLDARSRIQAEAAVREAEAALSVARSDVRKAGEERTYAQSQYDRVQTLVERGATSMTRLEDVAQQQAIADALVDAAESRQEMARGALERARAALIVPPPTGSGQRPAACRSSRLPTAWCSNSPSSASGRSRRATSSCPSGTLAISR